MRGTPPASEDQDAAALDPRDRRRHQRKQVLWAARLETAAGSYDCVVLNLSLGGAKLQLAAAVLPRSANLVLDRLGSLRAEVVWQVKDAVGLRFVADPADTARVLHRVLSL